MQKMQHEGRGVIVTAIVLTLSGVTIGLGGVASAEPPNYLGLPVDPNIISDSTAYIAEPAVVNPDGQPGVQQTFTHRDDSRSLTDTVLVLADPPAAGSALNNLQSELGASVVDSTTVPVPVGENGIIVSGTSPDGLQAVSVLLFTRGTTAAEIEFTGSPNDPAPQDLIVNYGQRQDDAIKAQLHQ